jgi:hypothetical protein
MKNGGSPRGLPPWKREGIHSWCFNRLVDYWAVTERDSVEDETAGAIPPVLWLELVRRMLSVTVTGSGFTTVVVEQLEKTRAAMQTEMDWIMGFIS